MDVQEIGWHVDSIDVAQDRGRWRCVVTAVMYFQVPSKAGNFLPSPGTVIFIREYLNRRERRVPCAGELKSLTQEIAVDLHRMDRVSQHWR